MALAKQERELVDKLRKKYSGQATSAVGQQMDLDSSDASPQGDDTHKHTTGTGVDVRICAICQGSGVQTEVYEFRRLERTCGPCMGTGVMLYKNGKEVEESTNTHQGQPANNQPAGKQGKQRDQHQLNAEVDRIRRRIQAYEQEHHALSTAVQSSTDVTAQQLTQDVVKHLDKQLARLRQLEVARASELAELQTS
eukprot:jgi/Chrzof1/14405/Cz09g01100.t1